MEHVLLHDDPVEGNNSLHGCFPNGIFEQDSVNVSTYSSTTCSTVDCNAISPLYNTNNENIDAESDHQILTSDTSCSDKSNVLSCTRSELLSLRDNVVPFSDTTYNVTWEKIPTGKQGMGKSLKMHFSFDSAIVHRPLLLYSLAKHHVHARFCIVNSAPAQSVRVCNDLIESTNQHRETQLNLYNVWSYGTIQHSLSDRTCMCCVVRVPYRSLSNSRSGWVDA